MRSQRSLVSAHRRWTHAWGVGRQTTPSETRRWAQSREAGSRPGGGVPFLMRCGRILRTCAGSVITAMIFMGLWHRGQHRGLPQAGAWEVRFVDLLDQAGPASRRFLRNGCRPWGGAALFGGYGQLGLRLFGWTDAEGWLGLAGPPSRRASAPAGLGVPRAREEYRP
jgi:hypothetical protein